MSRVDAPWTQDQVDSLNAWQQAGYVHPFTGIDSEPLIATTNGWVETEGGPIVQTWAHDFMLDWSWQRPFLQALQAKR